MTNLAEINEAISRRKRPGEGRDPLLNIRAPKPLIAIVRERAGERRISMSALVREALERHVGHAA
jgi:Ribbon-helix-helix protein, copG family